MLVSAKQTISLHHHMYASEQTKKKSKGADRVIGARTMVNNAKAINVFRCVPRPPIVIQRWKVRRLWPQDWSS